MEVPYYFVKAETVVDLKDTDDEKSCMKYAEKEDSCAGQDSEFWVEMIEISASEMNAYLINIGEINTLRDWSDLN